MLLTMRLRTALLGPIVCFALGGAAGGVVATVYHPHHFPTYHERRVGGWRGDQGYNAPASNVPEPGSAVDLGSALAMLIVLAVGLRKWRK